MAYVEVNGVWQVEVPGVTPFGAAPNHPYRVGDKIGFRGERLRYTVQAADGRFLVCNKPMNALKTTLYCIVDMRDQIRGPENLVFGMGAETKKQCKEVLERIQKAESEISYRHRATLDIDRWEKKKKNGKKQSRKSTRTR